MTEQSGCDPQAAVEARLRHLLVENPSVREDRETGAFIIDDPALTDEEYNRLHDAWIKLNPRLKVVITQPLAYIPMNGPAELIYPDGTRAIVQRDPGDESDAAA